jgi:hypothetical protein
MSYSRMVRSTLRSVAQDMMSGGGGFQGFTADYLSLRRNDEALFRGDLSEQIVDHKLSILKREFPDKYNKLESTVRNLQCKVRVRRAKSAFALRKQVRAQGLTLFSSPVVPTHSLHSHGS